MGRPGDQLHILLVDRQPIFLAALAELITAARPEARIQTTTDSGQAIEVVSSEPVDLLFCDVRAEPLGGAELAVQATSLSPKTRVILLADPEDRALLVESLSGGAVGFFTKDASPEEFLEGVDAVLAGQYVVGHDLIRTTLRRLTTRPASHPSSLLAELTPVERDILRMVGRAASIAAIAQSRSISQKTVRNHLASIYRKLHVHNRSEAILLSARMGLTSGREPER